MNQNSANQSVVLSIASIFAFRMLGLFMLMPVFTIYADNLSGATHGLVGIAFGIYGLSQGLLQIPLGFMSDKIGRKPIITFGLILFAIGSIIAAMTSNIYLMIFARFLQGTGAIGSTLMALLADLTPEDQRTKSMALVGMTIGISFSVAIVLGPLIAKLTGLSGIFWCIAALACLGIVMLHTTIPNPKKEVFHSDSEAKPALFKEVLRNKELLRLDLGIFFQHAIFTATFFVIPMLLENQLEHAWYFYLPILVLSFLTMIPLIIIAEKKYCMKQIFLTAVALLVLAQIGLSLFHQALSSIAIYLFIYFVGFNCLEASLPSLVSKIAPSGSKGTAMGIYSSSQFLGIFFGGSIAGLVYQQQGTTAVFLVCVTMSVLWLLASSSMSQPKYLSTKSFGIAHLSEQEISSISSSLEGIGAVTDVFIAEPENRIYLKINKRLAEASTLEDLEQLFHRPQHA